MNVLRLYIPVGQCPFQEPVSGYLILWGEGELTIFTHLTFRGQCIVKYSYNKSQRDALFHKFILVKNSKCFGQIYCTSSGVSTLYTQQ